MTISITCPSCSKQYRLKDELAGRTIRCRDCGEEIRIGKATAGERPVRQRRSDDNDPADTHTFGGKLPPRRGSAAGRNSGTRSGARTSGGNRQHLWVAAGIGIFGTIILLAVVLLRSGRNSNENSLAQNSQPQDQAQTSGGSPLPQAAGSSVPPSANPAAYAPSVAASDSSPANSSTPAANSPSASGFLPGSASQSSSTSGPTGFPLEPDTVVIEWGRMQGIELSPTSVQPLFPSAPTPVVATGFGSGTVTGSECWNLATGRKIGQLQGQSEPSGDRSLSPDGQILAALDGKRKNVDIWSYQTGQRVGTIPVEQGDALVNAILCPSSTRVITYTLTQNAGSFQKSLKLFDAGNGQLLKTVTPEQPVNLKDLAVSHGGKYLASVERKAGITFYRSDTLEEAARVPSPVNDLGNPSGAAFNSAGTQLAVVWTTHNQTRIASISLTDGSVSETSMAGNLTMSPVTGDSYLGPAIEWLPDGSGWLLFGRTVIDAASGLRLWIIDSEGLNGSARRQLLREGLLVRSGGFNLQTGRSTKPELKVLKWPQADAQKSLLALSENTAARLKAGTAVGVRVETDSLRHGQPEETRTQLEQAFRERLSADGMLSEGDSGAVLYAHYSELDGQQMFQRQNRGRPGQPVQPPAGGGIQSTVAMIKLEYRLAGESKPAWTSELLINPSVLVIRGDASAQSARDAMFRTAQWQITAAPIPYFIPEDKSLVMLPGQTMYESR